MAKKETLENEELNQEETQSQEENENTAAEEQQDQAKSDEPDWKDRYMRLHAEFDNFRKRTSRERIELIKNANADLITDLLPVLDDLDRAIKANESNDDIKAVKEGFDLISTKFLNLLTSKGVKPIDAEGKEFNVDHHEALTQIPVDDKKKKGKVIEVIEKGYFLNDNVLRYSKVVVGS